MKKLYSLVIPLYNEEQVIHEVHKKGNSCNER
jgi:hypothetical protein